MTVDEIQSVLVVAPDESLRRSIAFALEAEGLRVETFSDLRSVPTTAATASSCAVIDENAVLLDKDGWNHVAALTDRVVLLVDRLRRVPEHYAPSAVHKPLLGRRLVEAVIPAEGLRRGPG